LTARVHVYDSALLFRKIWNRYLHNAYGCGCITPSSDSGPYLAVNDDTPEPASPSEVGSQWHIPIRARIQHHMLIRLRASCHLMQDIRHHMIQSCPSFVSTPSVSVPQYRIWAQPSPDSPVQKVIPDLLRWTPTSSRKTGHRIWSFLILGCFIKVGKNINTYIDCSIISEVL